VARPRNREVAARALPQDLNDTNIPASVYKELIRELWVPHLGELMMKELEIALGDSKQASDARARIQDRIAGKVPQQVQQDSSMSISISIRPVHSSDEAKLPPPPAITLIPDAYRVEEDTDGS
jgi:hypothetical protein